MNLFDPTAAPPQQDCNGQIIRELDAFAAIFNRRAASAHKQATALTFAACAQLIEDRIDELRRQYR